MSADWDVVVLTGGAGRRMAALSKPELEVAGSSLLGRVLSALAGAGRVIVVGPRARTTAGVDVWVREDPPGGGPAAALAAGVAEVGAPFTAVVAGDLPFLTPAAMTQLRAAADSATAAVAVDDRGRDQYLLAIWPTAVLRHALASAGSASGSAVRAVYHAAPVRRVRLPGTPPPWWDCDTPQQLARARAWAEAGAHAPDASSSGTVSP